MTVLTYNSSPSPASVQVDVLGIAGGVSPYSPELLTRLMEKGSIHCNKCSGIMPPTGICPACNRTTCHIEIYWKIRAPYKIYRTKSKVLHGYNSAAADLIAINRQMKDKGDAFTISEWLTGKLEERKLRNILPLWLADKDDEVKKGKKAPGGIAPYHSYTRKYYMPYFSENDISEIDKHIIKRFYKHLEKQPIKHKTQKNIMDGFHAFMEWCLDSEEDYIQAIPPFPTVTVTDSTPQRAIDEYSQQAAIDRIPEKHRDPFILMAEMCLRPGEVVAFQIQDYVPDFEGRLWVRRTESKCRIKENTKANTKILMKLTEDAHEVVKRHIEGRFGDTHLEEWLLINPATGRRYTVDYLNDGIWKKYSGLDISVYEAFKHSSLTHLSKHGDAYLVRDAGRHSDIRTSQRYVHRNQEKLWEAMNKRGKVKR